MTEIKRISDRDVETMRELVTACDCLRLNVIEAEKTIDILRNEIEKALNGSTKALCRKVFLRIDDDFSSEGFFSVSFHADCAFLRSLTQALAAMKERFISERNAIRLTIGEEEKNPSEEGP